MTQTPARGYWGITASIIVAGVLISASVFFAVSGATKTVTVDGSSPTTGSSGDHYVFFQQIGACSPEFWGVPWSVTIGGVTEVQPQGTPLPLINYGLSGTTDKNLTIIAFSLPDGTYGFDVSPSQDFFTPQSGTVVVSGSDVLVDIAYTGTSCTTTTGVTTSTSVQGFTREFRVTFTQTGECSPTAYVAPWSVTLGSAVEVEPASATLPIQNDTYAAGPLYQNDSTIIFSVPDGTYQFRVAPSSAFGQNSGTITVDGADITMVLNGPILSCTTTLAATLSP